LGQVISHYDQVKRLPGRPAVSLLRYGGKPDARQVTDAAMSSTVNPTFLNSATANFTDADIGKTIRVAQAGGWPNKVAGTIVSRNSATQVVLSVAATATVNNVGATWGTDSGPALDAALAALVATGGGTILFDGSFLIATAVLQSFFDVSNSDTVVLRGTGSNSRLYIATVAADTAIEIQSAMRVVCEGLSFVGTPGEPNDALVALRLNSCFQSVVRDCDFYGICTASAGNGAVIAFNNGILDLYNTRFSGCAGSTAVGNPLVRGTSWVGFRADNVLAPDYGHLDGIEHSKTPIATSYAAIYLAAPAQDPHSNSFSQGEAVFERVLTDEGCFYGIVVQPGGAVRVNRVRVSGCEANVNSITGAAGVALVNVDEAEIARCWYGYNTTVGTYYGVECYTCTRVRLDNVIVANSVDGFKFDTCTAITLKDSPYTTLLLTSSPQPKIITSGVEGHAQSATAKVLTSAGGAPSTIDVGTVETARVAPAAAVTGIILAAGTVPGQELVVVNESVAGSTVTFAASGTSRVADGAASIVAGLTSRKFVWNSATSLWYPSK
jgi:hypothetical protein